MTHLGMGSRTENIVGDHDLKGKELHQEAQSKPQVLMHGQRWQERTTCASLILDKLASLTREHQMPHIERMKLTAITQLKSKNMLGPFDFYIY